MSTIDERWNIVDTTRAFCQKVLPLVYDESLSYMEMVCKLSAKLNEVIENNNNLPRYVKDLIKETVNSDEFTQIVGSVLMDTIINVKFPPEGITPAKGDGVTDDTSSIQACFDYANNQGGAVVFFPSGKYLTGTLSINTETSILGADRYNTSLVLKGGGNTPLLQGVINQSVRNISLDGNRLNQIEENYLIDGTIDMALFDNVMLRDSAHCITADACNNSEFCNVMCKDIGDSVFITAAGNNNLLTNINTKYAINLTGNNNNWQSQQQTKIDSAEPLVYQNPKKLNSRFNYVEFQYNNNPYKVLVEGNLQTEAFVNVLDYGVKNDGSEDVAEILNKVMQSGGNFFFPAGTYRVDTQLILNSNTTILGEGWNSVIMSSENADLVYHTVCNKNASNINARLARNVQGNGFPAVTDFMTTADININILNLCIDGNWQNRDKVTWQKVCTEYGASVNREPGTGIEMQFVQNCNIINCLVKNAPQHNINIRGGSNSYSMGIDYVGLFPSSNCTVQRCRTENQLYDDCITTHDSEHIAIRDCYVFVNNSERSAAISNGIEIDDGSRFIVVENCISEGSFIGFQAKGHNSTPPAHNVTFQNCLARNVHQGFVITGDTSLMPSEGQNVGQVRFITLKDCSIDKIYPFSNATSWEGESLIMLVYGALNLTIDGFNVTNVNKSDFNNIGTLRQCYMRFRFSTQNLVIKNAYIEAANDNTTPNALISCEGYCRNVKLENIIANIPDSRYIFNSTYNGMYSYYDFNNVMKVSSNPENLIKIGDADSRETEGLLDTNYNMNNVRASNSPQLMWQRNLRPLAYVYTSETNVTTELGENQMLIVNRDCTITLTAIKVLTKSYIAVSTTASSDVNLTIITPGATFNRVVKPGGIITLMNNSNNNLFVS